MQFLLHSLLLLFLWWNCFICFNVFLCGSGFDAYFLMSVADFYFQFNLGCNLDHSYLDCLGISINVLLLFHQHHHHFLICFIVTTVIVTIITNTTTIIKFILYYCVTAWVYTFLQQPGFANFTSLLFQTKEKR